MTQTGHNDYEVSSIEQESGEPTDEVAVVEGVETEIPVLEDVGHPFVPHNDNTYILREVDGGIYDIGLLSFEIEDPDFFVILEGEAGTGKDMSIMALAEAANWPARRVNFGMGTTYSDLVGHFSPVDGEDDVEEAVSRAEAIRKTALRIVEQGDNVDMGNAMELAAQSIPQGSSFTWTDGILTKAVKYGWWFVADELNAADESAIMPLNGLTEDRESRYLTIEEKSEVITPHPRFRFIATQNPAGYAGVGELNDAFQSRAFILEYDYLPEEAELAILKERTNIVENSSEAAALQLIRFANDIRKQEQSGNNYLTKISTRDLIKVGKLTDIMDIRPATRNVFSGIAYEEDKAAIEEDLRGRNFQ